MLRRVAVVGACVLGAGLFATSLALAEDLNPEQARAFVVGKLFSYTCFEGTAGSGRIFARRLGRRHDQDARPGRDPVRCLAGGNDKGGGHLDVRASAGSADHPVL